MNTSILILEDTSITLNPWAEQIAALVDKAQTGGTVTHIRLPFSEPIKPRSIHATAIRNAGGSEPFMVVVIITDAVSAVRRGHIAALFRSLPQKSHVIWAHPWEPAWMPGSLRSLPRCRGRLFNPRHVLPPVATVMHLPTFDLTNLVGPTDTIGGVIIPMQCRTTKPRITMADAASAIAHNAILLTTILQMPWHQPITVGTFTQTLLARFPTTVVGFALQHMELLWRRAGEIVRLKPRALQALIKAAEKWAEAQAK